MMNELLKVAKKNIVNLPGWRTDKKIIVIESDDWGMVRMSSKKTYHKLLQKGFPVDQCPYNSNDALETNSDLENLFEVLNSVTDKNGNPGILTANHIVANPDFDKIRRNNFNKYYYEPFTATIDRLPGRDRVFELYKNGIEAGLIYPQFHGREHLNVNRWMYELRTGNKALKTAFDHEMYTVRLRGQSGCRPENLDAFGMAYQVEYESESSIIKSGLQLFKKLWGYNSKTFIAPCYIWPLEIEKILAENGVCFIQGTHVQRVPCKGMQLRIKPKYHYQGKLNRHGQRYLVRNVFFEPTEKPDTDIVSKTLKDIQIAFNLRKPAIICSHRVNYMGSLRPQNRDKNLKLLKELLLKILDRYPEVEFMSSAHLGELMSNKG